MRNSDVNNWAYFLFLATIRIPVVSLSILWTGYGYVSLNSLVLFNISKMFLFDLVPDWTEIPAGLLITEKLGLSSINIFEEKIISFFDGL